jgi:hypothetical protein
MSCQERLGSADAPDMTSPKDASVSTSEIEPTQHPVEFPTQTITKLHAFDRTMQELDVRRCRGRRNIGMHSPTRLRFLGQDWIIASHVTSPDGTVRLSCTADRVAAGRVELFEGDAFLTGARLEKASIELVVEPEREF